MLTATRGGVAAALVAAPITTLLSAQPAGGAFCQAENPASTHHVVIGSSAPNDAIVGVQAKVTAQDGFVCLGNLLEQFYTAYVMVNERAANQGEFATGWGQSGFVEDWAAAPNFTDIWHYGQTKKDLNANNETDFWLQNPAAAGTEYKYTINYDFQIDRLVALAGVNTVHTSSFDPFIEGGRFGNGWDAPWGWQMGGEQDNQGGGLPGDVNNRTLFRDYQHHEFGGWMPGLPDGNLAFANDDAAPDPPIWRLQLNDCGADCFEIWTE